MIEGIFLGYVPRTGGKVGNDMYFVDLDLFATMNYRTGVRNCDKCKVYIDESAEWTVVNNSGYHFPLKSEYDRHFQTIAGLESDLGHAVDRATDLGNL